MEQVEPHPAGVGGADRVQQVGELVVVSGQVHVALRAVQQRPRPLGHGRPGAERLQRPELHPPRGGGKAGQANPGVGEAAAELAVELPEQVLSRDGDEAGRVGADLHHHPLVDQPAQRLVDLGLRDPGRVGQRIPGHRLLPEQAEIGPGLILREAKLHQPLSQLGRRVHRSLHPRVLVTAVGTVAPPAQVTTV